MTKKELKEIIKEDKKIYFYNEDIEKRCFHLLVKSFWFEAGKYIIISRKAGYYKENRKKFINKILCIYYMKKKNKLGRKLGLDIAPSYFGRRIKIWHGNVVINYNSIIGDDCEFHGNNCIGNNYGFCPILGNNIDIGVGANIIGNVKLEDNIVVGANALVNKSFLEKNIVIAGVPAKKIK